eukprot:4486402-Pyramimonas_sp.AAC.1
MVLILEEEKGNRDNTARKKRARRFTGEGQGRGRWNTAQQKRLPGEYQSRQRRLEIPRVIC